MLREEVCAALKSAPLEALILEELPYLRAVIREQHRITPALQISSVKSVNCELELGGFHVPAGAIVMLDNSMGCDPKLCDEPDVFRPERWLPAAVAARKGTPAEVLDHRLLAAPFSAGARKCPGSRVAQLEVRAMLATIVRDWHFELATPVTSVRDLPYLSGTTLSPFPMPKFTFTPTASSSP
mmetsp:Transcript_39593/g.97870  ORF Transcript_39593/g.97870 Transcript_39593/m.97870 type:complete len:183 (+) Transcript_39593:388-936(+)